MATGKKSILVASCEGEWRDELARAVREQGHEVATADDGETVAACLADAKADAIVLDANLRGTDRMDVLRMHEPNAKGHRTKIIFVSGSRSDDEFSALLRKRGVSRLVARWDEIVDWVRAVEDTLFWSVRAHQRFSFPKSMEVEFEGRALDAKGVDISRSGMALQVRRKHLPEAVAVGCSVVLRLPSASGLSSMVLGVSALSSMGAGPGGAMFGAGSFASHDLPGKQWIELPAIVRHIRAKSRWLGDTSMLGVQFQEMSERAAEGLDKLLVELSDD